MEKAVLKVGGSVITEKNSREPLPLREEMERTAEEISGFEGSLILVHGAGSFGHPLVKRTSIMEGIDEKEDRRALSELQTNLNRLTAEYADILREKGVPAFPVQSSAFLNFDEQGRLEGDLTVIERILEMGMVPLISGSGLIDHRSEVSILSGDLLAPFLCRKLDFEKVLHATDVKGVYDRYPSLEEAELLEEIDQVPESASESGKIDVSGGMKNKIEECLKIEKEGVIFSGKEPGNLEKALSGEKVGTLVKKK